MASPSPDGTWSAGPYASASAPAGCLPPPVADPLPWWNDRVFYEVFVRSFQDSDGDGTGDLRGLIDRLDYLNDGDPATTADLGIDGIWLMPVAEAASYHGYDVVDYRSIESDYGTADDFRTLVAEAHKRGIAVIVDLVLNHTSIDHPWFQESRTPGSARETWYRWADAHPGYAGPDGQRVWHADGNRFYYGLFWEGMPDLNLENPDVTAELVDVARFWLTDLGVDGFRLDAAKHLVEDGEEQENTRETRAWLTGFRSTLHAIHSEALVLGEVWDTRIVTASYVAEGSLDLVFDFDLAGTIPGAVRLGDAGTLMASLADIAERYPDGRVAPFLSNHDQNRILSQLSGSAAAARTAGAILLTIPGTPFLYYGEELGMTGSKPDERIRTPFPWTAAAPGHGFTESIPWEPFGDQAESANVALQTADPDSLLSVYRRLVRARTQHAALARGILIPLRSSHPSVAAWIRQTEDETILVVHALSDQPVVDVAFALERGLRCGLRRAEVVLATVPGTGDVPGVTAPESTPDGGFAGYRPLPELPPYSSWIIRLSP